MVAILRLAHGRFQRIERRAVEHVPEEHDAMARPHAPRRVRRVLRVRVHEQVLQPRLLRSHADAVRVVGVVGVGVVEVGGHGRRRAALRVLRGPPRAVCDVRRRARVARSQRERRRVHLVRASPLEELRATAQPVHRHALADRVVRAAVVGLQRDRHAVRRAQVLEVRLVVRALVLRGERARRRLEALAQPHVALGVGRLERDRVRIRRAALLHAVVAPQEAAEVVVDARVALQRQRAPPARLRLRAALHFLQHVAAAAPPARVRGPQRRRAIVRLHRWLPRTERGVAVGEAVPALGVRRLKLHRRLERRERRAQVALASHLQLRRAQVVVRAAVGGRERDRVAERFDGGGPRVWRALAERGAQVEVRVGRRLQLDDALERRRRLRWRLRL
mmetsp:Transcript_3868/g.11457  ORF Transcript_3868/g.11457 Transcript_3868/m.11457 type:complete len:391 (+) Transcript_3868:384-1556(+)